MESLKRFLLGDFVREKKVGSTPGSPASLRAEVRDQIYQFRDQISDFCDQLLKKSGHSSRSDFVDTIFKPPCYSDLEEFYKKSKAKDAPKKWTESKLNDVLGERRENTWDK